MAEGQIYKIHSDFYYVDDGVNSFECKIREVLKKQKEKILVGDFVEFENGVITNLIERKNFIRRPSVANIDQIIIVSALKQPDLDLHQLNRYIALAKYYNIPTVLCFNKEDLKWERQLGEKIKKIYSPLGYKIVFTSATEHKGIKNFEKLLDGKTSVLCGNSGGTLRDTVEKRRCPFGTAPSLLFLVEMEIAAITAGPQCLGACSCRCRKPPSPP